MSAEKLREAAKVLRRDWPVNDLCPDRCLCNEGASDYGNAYHPEADYHQAVAEWLTITARELDALGNPDLTKHPRDGRRTAALAVADAILGGA